jgi:hypothetical protein
MGDMDGSPTFQFFYFLKPKNINVSPELIPLGPRSFAPYLITSLPTGELIITARVYNMYSAFAR